MSVPIRRDLCQACSGALGEQKARGTDTVTPQQGSRKSSIGHLKDAQAAKCENKPLQTKMLMLKTPRMGVNGDLGGRICISIRKASPDSALPRQRRSKLGTVHKLQ
jgi:hypothetical protein